MVGNGVLRYAAVGRIGGRCAIVTVLAHHIPGVIVDRAGTVARVGQSEPVPHFMLYDRDIVIGPWRFPGRAPAFEYTVQIRTPGPAPGPAVIKIGVKHHVYPAIERKIHTRIGGGGAIVE
jgi:hypothetical protein